MERDTEANARLYDMIKHEEFIKSVKTEYWPLNTSLVQGIIRPHQCVIPSNDGTTPSFSLAVVSLKRVRWP